VYFSVGAAAALFAGWTPDVTPRLRSLTLCNVGLMPAAARALAASGWRLEELDVSANASLGDAGVAVLVGAPHSVQRRRGAGAAPEPAPTAEAPWPLVLNVRFSAVQHTDKGTLVLNVRFSVLGEAGIRALASRRWPRLRSLDARGMSLTAACDAALESGEWPALEKLWLGDSAFPARLTLGDALRVVIHDA
jgi:hypothetical protein